MEMSPEIAVLVSAIQLSSKYNIGKEESCHTENLEKSLEILKHAIGEITEGLEVDRNKNQKSLWQHKLHSIFFTSVLRSSWGLEAGKTGTLGYLQSVADLFPPIDQRLYYELVKQCGWRDYLVECLSYLRVNEDVCLQILQDILSYCLERQQSSESNDLDLVLAVTEQLVSINFVKTESGDEVDENRRASGLYEDMGQKPSTESAPPDDRNRNYQSVFVDLLSCVREVFRSSPAPGLPGHAMSGKELRAHPLARLIIGVTALGGTHLLGNAMVSLGASDHELQQRWEKWSAIFVFTTGPGQSSVSRQSCDDLRKCIAKLQNLSSMDVQLTHDNKDILREIRERDTHSNHAGHCPNVLPTSLRGCCFFPLEEWCNFEVEFLQGLVWTECLTACLEFKEDKTFDTSGIFSTAELNLCQLFTEFRRLLVYLLSTNVLSSNSQPTKNIPEPGECDNGTSQVKESQKMETISSSTKGPGDFNQLLKLLQPLANVANELLEKDTQLNSPQEMPALKNLTLEQKLVRIEERFLGWEECVDSILDRSDHSVWSHERMYAVLADNVDILRCEGRLFRLVDVIQTQNLSNDQKSRLWKIILAAFSGLPVLLQDRLVCDCYTRGSHSQLGMETLSQQSLTLVFNRLVDGGLAEVKEVVNLALRDVPAVMHKAVSIAVRNNGQFLHIVKILRNIPNTCRARHEVEHPDTPMLCKVIHTFLATNSITQTEEQNLLNFVELAVKPFEDDHSLHGFWFTEDPVLDPHEFLDICVLPYLNRDNMVLGSQPITARLALKLFRVISSPSSEGQGQIESMEGQGHSTEVRRRRITAPQPLVNLLCLCEMLQECNKFRDCESVTRKELMKPDLISAIDDLVQTLLADIAQISDPALGWFSELVRSLDTPVILRVRHLYRGDKDQLQILANKLCHELQGGTCGLSEFLKFSSVDDDCLWASLYAIDHLNRDVGYEQLVGILVELLPNLLSSEWRRALVVSNHMVCREKSAMDCTFISSVPLTDLSELQSPLCLMQLLVDVFMIWSQSDWMTQDMWLHVTPGFVAIVKTFCLPDSAASTAQRQILRKVFHLTQIFCQLCQVMTILPPCAMEQVYVLLLQTLSVYKSTREQLGTASSANKFCEEQEVTMGTVIEFCIHGNTEWTVNLATQLTEIRNIT